MSTSAEPRHPARFVGVDLHKHFAVIGAVNQQQQVVLPPQRVPLEDLVAWGKKYLKATDALVLEASSNAWTAYDLLAPLVGRCVVANPLQGFCWQTVRAEVARMAGRHAVSAGRLVYHGHVLATHNMMEVPHVCPHHTVSCSA